MTKQASTTNPDGSTTFVLTETVSFEGTAAGPVRHGENTHPADSGLRSVESLLHSFPGIDTRATRAVRETERRRVAPMFPSDDMRTARLPRVVLTASAPLAGAR